MVTVCCALAIAIPNIGVIISLLGATTNPLVGFIFPIVYYLKLHPEVELWRKVIAFFVFSLIVVVSVASLIYLVIDLAS